MKKIIVAVIAFIICADYVFSQSRTAVEETFYPDPRGFRGIAWGQRISDTQGLKSIGALNFARYGDIFSDTAKQHVLYFMKEWKGEGYVNEKEDFKIGYAVADEIIYLFWNDRFFGAVIESLGSLNRDELEKALIAWLGSITNVVRTSAGHTVIWERKSVRVILDFRRTVLARGQDIKLYIISREMESRFIGF
ncbi:MAG: hypothetical protein JW957_09275 [Candidatus Omnitrophica bacterium]|nr:hypothetical protein [Candidatus Omnitrophota bacterium]